MVYRCPAIHEGPDTTAWVVLFLLVLTLCRLLREQTIPPQLAQAGVAR